MSISYTSLEAKVQRMIKPSRFQHSLGVAEVSSMLASRFGLDTGAAEYIGIYHDAYRYSGALAAVHFDEDAEGEVPGYYKTAVRHHTLGSKDMGPYGAVVYIADYTEPGRKHLTDEDRERIFSCQSLEDMIIMIMDMQRKYFRREGIAEAGVSTELYSFIKDGGKL